MELLDGSPAFIIGAVIHHQEFPLRKGLVHDRLNGLFQELASVEGWQDDTDQGKPVL
jgi:hypothetical protein